MSETSTRAEGNAALFLVGGGVLILIAALVLAVVPLKACPDVRCGMARATPSLGADGGSLSRPDCPGCGGLGKVPLFRAGRGAR